jgi:hypothetical protein
MKFEDINGSGAYEAGTDEPLEGWTIDIWTLDEFGDPAVKAYTDMTNADGEYIFDMLMPGQDYLVCEVLPEDWKQSYPMDSTLDAAECPTALGYAPWGYQINLDPGEVDDDNHFGNWQYATKAGMKFEDVNGSAAYEMGIDKPLEDWTIDIWTLDEQGAPDVKVYTDTTNVDGEYSFDMLVPGVDYLVCEVLPEDWEQSYPMETTTDAAACPTAAGYAPWGYQINLESAEIDDDNHFGNWQYATKSGTKWNDLNADGIWMSEPVLSGWTIDVWTLDAEGEPVNKVFSTTTNADGKYDFDMLVPGVDYIVCEVLPDGWYQSYPTMETEDAAACPTDLGYAPWGYQINLASAEIDSGNNFGNYEMMGCTYTQGYWKTHSEYGPAPYDSTWSKLDDGADTEFFNTGFSWYEIFHTPPKGGNAYVILAHQYMAAYLNSIKDENPASLATVTEQMATAESLLTEYFDNYNNRGVPYIPEGDDRELAISTAEILDMFNNGNYGPPHCDAEEE